MSHLLDVNALVAWAWTDHPHHLRVDRWIEIIRSVDQGELATTSIVELGFVRVSVLRNPTGITVEMASQRLIELVGFLKTQHRFLPDDLSSCGAFPAWCKNPKNTTDAHLLALAEKHGLQLATLDTGIPGAFIIPE
jgi:predicted nucleic acid-binding protein